MLKVNFTPSHTHRVILSHFFTLMMLDIRRYVTLPDAPSVHLSYYSGKRDEFTHACTLKVLTVASCLQRHKRTYAQGNEDEVEEEESKVWIWTPPHSWSAVLPSTLSHASVQAASHLQNRCDLSGHVSPAVHQPLYPPRFTSVRATTLGLIFTTSEIQRICNNWSSVREKKKHSKDMKGNT